jgi:hypothetical protein
MSGLTARTGHRRRGLRRSSSPGVHRRDRERVWTRRRTVSGCVFASGHPGVAGTGAKPGMPPALITDSSAPPPTGWPRTGHFPRPVPNLWWVGARHPLRPVDEGQLDGPNPRPGRPVRALGLIAVDSRRVALVVGSASEPPTVTWHLLGQARRLPRRTGSTQPPDISTARVLPTASPGAHEGPGSGIRGRARCGLFAGGA